MNMNIRRRKIVLILIAISTLILIAFSFYFLRIKLAKIEVSLSDNLEVEFNEKRRVSSFIDEINGEIVDDYFVDTTKLGVKKVDFKYINDDNIRVSYSFDINVVDTTPPLIWVNTSYSLPVGSDVDLEDTILCGDNYDKRPKCSISGDYDLNTVGDYPLTYTAVDQSGNQTDEKFILKVYEVISDSSLGEDNEKRTLFSDVVEKYKTDKTKIGIDISKWQNKVDFAKLKEAGVEFVIIRVGTTLGIGGKYVIDEQFARNIKEANKYNIDVGLYFYSYANSVSSAKKDARWLIKNIKEYKINLPIAFDWEDWSNFNSYHISFYDLSNIGISFMSELEKCGYDTMLYSSKNYLEKIWLETGYDTWLAHYTEQTNYQGKYKFWQLCNNGRVDGIDGNVDIDIMYQK